VEAKLPRLLDMNFWDLFRRAALYAPDPTRGSVIHEPPARWRAFPYSERHLQCVWFDPDQRPGALRTSCGEVVTVEDAGVWNLEAGPDFLGAAIRVGPEQRRLIGDVEVHIHPADWKQHGHLADPRYGRVRVHVTYFPGSLSADDLPPGSVQISLQQTLAACPSFAFENIDLTAYPYAVRAALPPCRQQLQGWSRDEKELMLDAAGEERLRRKAERMALMQETMSGDQLLYEELFAALGYKQNKTPFRHLAALVPHDELRGLAKGDPDAAFAMLLGVARLLPEAPKPGWDGETRSVFRRWWDIWWRMRERFAARLMPAGSWVTAGLRPANHPVRRLMAAALLVAGRTTLREQWLAAAALAPRAALASLGEDLTKLHHDYWDRRWTLGGVRLSKPAALLGEERAEGILLNVFVPWLAASRLERPFEQGVLDQLPAEQDHAILRQTAFNLFGPHHPEVLYATGLRRQGLIQIFHDYCLNDRSRCAACAFPSLLGTHKESNHASMLTKTVAVDAPLTPTLSPREREHA
jgi:hypothetical protein